MGYLIVASLIGWTAVVLLVLWKDDDSLKPS